MPRCLSLKFLACLLIVFYWTINVSSGQDTFSIVAVDSTTGEVGSAGATCLDMDTLAGLISRVVPGTGAINAQSVSSQKNLSLGRLLLSQGNSSTKIIDSLKNNDADNSPQLRQNLVARLDGKSNPDIASFTGSLCLSYANDSSGYDYAVAGNILSGQHVLDSMINGYTRSKTASLSDRLMLAMYNAKIVGADKRCSTYGKSALSAFIKVAKKTDSPTKTYISLQTNTAGKSIDPLDSLMNLYLKLKLNRINVRKVFCRNDTIRAKIYGDFKIKSWKIDGKTYTNSTFSISNLSVGSHTLIGNYYFTNKHLVSDTITFSVVAGASVALPQDTTICANESLFLKATSTAAVTFKWSDGWNGALRGLTITKDTLLIVRGFDANGCSDRLDSIFIKNSDGPQIDLADRDTFCSGDSLIIEPKVSGQSPFIFYWNNNPSSSEQFKVSPKTETFYVFEVVDDNQCKNHDTIVIIPETLSVRFSTYDTSICTGDSIKVLGNVHYNNKSIDTPIWLRTNKKSSFANLPIGSHKAYYTSLTGCSDTAILVVREIINPKVPLGSDTIVCVEESIRFTFNQLVKWQDGLESKDRSFVITEDSLISASFVSLNNCLSPMDSIFIKAQLKPKSLFSIVQNGNSISLKNESSDYSGFNWDFGDGVTETDSLNPTHNYTKNGTYSVVLKTENPPCLSDTFSKTVTISNLDIEPIDLKTFQLFPNPFVNQLTITGTNTITGIELIDVSGRTVERITPNSGNNHVTISTQNLNPGFYTLTIMSGGVRYTYSVVKN